MQQTWSHYGAGNGVVVDTFARLHLGFLDMSASLGRRFGSLGVSIDAFHTRMHVRRATELSASGVGADRATRYAKAMMSRLDLREGAEIVLASAIPDHLGLGSGTQMALAVGRAMAAVHALPLDTRDVAALLGRGARSGIGVGAFDQGGFLIDSGVGDDGGVPPVTARLDFPEDWRILLVMDVRGKGLHGKQELEAFQRLPPFPRELAAHLCHLTLMQILPGVGEKRLEPVADGVAELQRRVGDHFAPAQGGRFTSPSVSEALALAEALGHKGVGQSSWGPTGFVLLPDQTVAEELVAETRKRFGDLSPLRLTITRVRNTGSIVKPATAVEAVKETS